MLLDLDEYSVFISSTLQNFPRIHGILNWSECTHFSVGAGVRKGMQKGREMPVMSTAIQTDFRHGQKKVYLISKRVLDLLVSAVGLIVTFLPMVIIGVLIKLETPGPAIYIHHRIGKDGAPLPLLKFRSMYSNADEMMASFTPEQAAEWEKNFKLEHDPRITKIGKFLRRSSLDELPQLVNVLKGELSLVGPRPIVTEELEKYAENKDKFLSVKPGLTGYWQAYARSSCTYEERMEMELHYVEKANFWWDIRIIFATFIGVLQGRGAQ